jgi:hypothetical protein
LLAAGRAEPRETGTVALMLWLPETRSLLQWGREDVALGTDPVK